MILHSSSDVPLAADRFSVGIDALSRLRSNSKLYPLEFDGRWVLFRIDGMIVRLSKLAHALLSVDPNRNVRQIVADVEAAEGHEALAECMAELCELAESFENDADIPDYIPLNNILRRSPSGILIMISQTCNLACSYCYAGGGTYGQPTKLQKTENALEAIDQLIVKSVGRKELNITFFGGEPLVNFKLIERIVAHCQQKTVETGKKFDYSITTNGTLVTEDIARFFRTHKFSVMVSFDGVPWYHNKYRPSRDGSTSYDAVRAGIRRLTEARVPVRLRGTLVREDDITGIVAGAVEEAKALGALGMNLTAADCLRSEDRHLELTVEQKDELAAYYEGITRANIEKAAAGHQEKPYFDPLGRTIKALTTGQAVGKGRCGACSGMAAVATNGTVYPCHRFVGMEEYKIGHIAAGGVDTSEVEKFFARASESAYPHCKSCMARLICGGMCFFTIADGKGGFTGPQEDDCNRARRGLRRAIEFVMDLEEMPRERAASYLDSF